MALKETEELNRLMLGVAVSRAICTVAELGVADHIADRTAVPVATLAQKTGTHERSLHRVLRLLASRGLFRETSPGAFEHTPLSFALREDAEGSYRAGARMFHRFFPAWDALDHSIRTGAPGFDRAFGSPLFDFVMANPAVGPLLDAGMSSFHGYETAAMLDAYDFSGVKTLADIGGGNGSLLTGALKRYPAMRGILFDIEHVLAGARPRIAAAGMESRVATTSGDFFKAVPSGGDAYIMKQIIHDWPDDRAVVILRNIHRALANQPNGRVILLESIIQTGDQLDFGKLIDIEMLLLPGGRERTEAEFRRLFELAGFKLARVVPTRSPLSVLEARPV